MSRIPHKRLQLQLLFAMAAVVSVAALTLELVSNAVRHAEGFVLADANLSLRDALREMERECALRISGDSAWHSLPASAQDLSLRAIANAVLSAYPGVEGGYWTGSAFLGYAFPTLDAELPKFDVPPAERRAIQETVEQARRQRSASRVRRGRHGLTLIAAADSGGASAWVMKRLPGPPPGGERDRSVLLAILVAVALLGAAGVLTTGIALRRGVAEIKEGLGRLDVDFNSELPVRPDELGEISAAINEMARARRRLEAEVRRDDRLRATGRLVARVAHEMRNPLNSMRLSLQMLAHRLSENRLRREDFQIALEEVDRMNRLLSDLLAFQQPRPPVVEASLLGPLAERCVELVRPQAEKRAVRLSVSGDGGVRAAVDEQYVTQVIVNVLLNALDVSDTGGMVRVEVASGAAGPEIRISDHGPGLSAEQQDRLFEPFYTTKPDGHGLGLAVSRELARSMGGDLVYAGSASGATFILRMQGLEHVL